MVYLGKVSCTALLSVSLCYAGCTNSPEKDIGATAVGTGVGVVICAVTLFACPAILAVGAGGGMLTRKVNVSQYNACMRRAPRNANGFRVREAHCKRDG
jgi:hypothetical protein